MLQISCCGDRKEREWASKSDKSEGKEKKLTGLLQKKGCRLSEGESGNC